MTKTRAPHSMTASSRWSAGLPSALPRDVQQAEEETHQVTLEIWPLAARFGRSRGAATGWITQITQITRARTIDRIRPSQAARTRDQRHSDHGYHRDFDR